MLYPINTIIAIDQATGARVENGSGYVYAVSDTARATPLSIFDLSGLPLTSNLLTTNSEALIPPFQVEGEWQVVFVSGDSEIILTSWLGLKEEAAASADAANAVVTKANNGEFKGAQGDSAYQVWLSLGNTGTVEDYRADIEGPPGKDGSNVIPTSQAIEQEVTTPGTPTSTALKATFVGEGELMLNVRNFGGAGDGVTDDTAAIQSTIDAANTRSGAIVFFPAGVYKYTQLRMEVSGVSLRGESDHSTFLENHGAGSGILLGTTTLGADSLHFADLTIRNRGFSGHLMEVPYSLSQSKFERVRMISNNPASSLLHCDRAEATGGVFDTIWDGGYYKMPLDSTVPGFNMVGLGSPANLLKWVGGRYEGGGTYMFHMEAGPGSYCYGNTWDGSNAEFPDHGFIRIYSGLGNTIIALGVQDCGTIDADLVHLGNTTGPQTRGTTIIGYNRSMGTLSGGAVDIHNVAGQNSGSLTLSGITGPNAAGVTADLGLGAGWATLIGVDSTVTVKNINPARTVILDPTRGLSAPSLKVGATSILAGATEPEGSVTAPVGTLYLCTSAYAGLPKVWEKRTGTGNTGWLAAGDSRGPLPSTSFASASHYVNTVGKYAGASGYDTTAARPVWATGATVTSPWVFADGTTAHTPA